MRQRVKGKTGWSCPREPGASCSRLAAADTRYATGVDLADGHQSHHVKTEIRCECSLARRSQRQADLCRAADGNILISQYLPLRRTSEPVIHPYTDILYSIPELKQLAATDPALLPLLDPDRDESDELSPALLDALHLATRSYDDIVKLVRFVRVDYNGACGFKRVQHRSILRSVATEIARTGWSRGSAHRCTGYATGLGFRNDQRGGVG